MLTGCQVVSGAGQYTQVRFIAASPDTPAVDVSQNGAPVLYGVGFGTASSYMPVAPGAYTYAIHTTALHQQLANTSGLLSAGGQYTVLVGNTAAELKMTVLKDQATAAPPGRMALRFVDEATRSSAVDLYLVAAGKTLTASSRAVVADVSFGNAPTYIDYRAGTYSVVAFPAGTVPGSSVAPLYSSNQLEFASGSARTIVLLDSPEAASSGLQAVLATDFDPSAN